MKLKQKKEELINKYATMFEILPNLGDLISTYSHGMKQKLVIISALIHKPQLLVLMTVCRIGSTSFALKQVMREMCKKEHQFSFLHVLEVVEKLCDKVGIMEKEN